MTCQAIIRHLSIDEVMKLAEKVSFKGLEIEKLGSCLIVRASGDSAGSFLNDVCIPVDNLKGTPFVEIIIPGVSPATVERVVSNSKTRKKVR